MDDGGEKKKGERMMHAGEETWPYIVHFVEVVRVVQNR
jgi:hypothetical protein